MFLVIGEKIKINELKLRSPHRGHSRNRPKGGRNSPKRNTSTRLADHFFSGFNHKEFRSLLKELYLLPIVENFAQFTALNWFEDIT